MRFGDGISDAFSFSPSVRENLCAPTSPRQDHQRAAADNALARLAPRFPQNLPRLNELLNSSRTGQPPWLQRTSVVRTPVERLGGGNTAAGNSIVKFLKLFAREHVVLLGFRSPPRHKEMLADSPFLRQPAKRGEKKTRQAQRKKKTRRAASSSVREEDLQLVSGRTLNRILPRNSDHVRWTIAQNWLAACIWTMP
jgi:hypothetical protein